MVLEYINKSSYKMKFQHSSIDGTESTIVRFRYYSGREQELPKLPIVSK
jgi:hypothetical protein